MMSILGTKDCYGCGVCAAACKRNAISMVLNAFGFYEPEVDETICVDCGICVDVCSFRKDGVEHDDAMQPECFAGWSKDNGVRNVCSSGGVGYEIGRHLLRHGYAAIVCGYNPVKSRTEHFLAMTEEDLKRSIGSKYIQSNAFPAFSQIQKENNYLIVGTPCQIDSISRWMKMMKMRDRVILMDFFCHGVPSMLMWDKYQSYVEGMIGHFDDIVWRDKETGWHDSWVMKVTGRYVSRFSDGDLFYQMYLKNRCLSKPCYEKCKFKGLRSAADIRIGDLWGSKYSKNEEGVSGIVCLTDRGKSLLENMRGMLSVEASTADIVCESQMKKCARRPLSYAYVMKALRSETDLPRINKVAHIIDMIEDVPLAMRYYASRLPVKMMELVKRVAVK